MTSVKQAQTPVTNLNAVNDGTQDEFELIDFTSLIGQVADIQTKRAQAKMPTLTIYKHLGYRNCKLNGLAINKLRLHNKQFYEFFKPNKSFYTGKNDELVTNALVNAVKQFNNVYPDYPILIIETVVDD